MMYNLTKCFVFFILEINLAEDINKLGFELETVNFVLLVLETVGLISLF